MEKDERRQPNDLMVDRSGGIFYLNPHREKWFMYLQREGNYRCKRYTNPQWFNPKPDEKTLYVSEYVPKNIISFAVGESGELSDRALFAKMDDGLQSLKELMECAWTSAGNIYCAGPKDIWIWNADGKLVDKIACRKER